MSMTRINIYNKTGLTDQYALTMVRRVILDGFQSTETIQGKKNVPKYCHVTTFKNVYGKRIIVWARPRKTTTSAYSFLVYDEEEMQDHE